LKSKFSLEVPIIICNANDKESIRAMTAQAKVLINCVGPFIKYGEQVVQACLETKTHYTDITGEPQFIKRMVASYHSDAEAKKVLVISAAGFDSVPADMGVFFYAQQLKGKSELKQVEAYLAGKGGGMSYGTYNTIIESLSNGPAPSGPKENNPSGKRARNIQKMAPHYSENVKAWVFPFNFTSDPYIVTRSRRLCNQEDFSYAQYMVVGGFINAFLMGLGLLIFFVIVKIPGGAGFLRSLKQEGSGPSEEVRKKATTRITFYGVDDKGAEQNSVAYSGPEGYTATAICAVESALTMLEDYDKLPMKGGVCTTASALGSSYLDRLQKTGSIKFQ
jgi:short subunit dehydrogenase-like uncharacterized protein